LGYHCDQITGERGDSSAEAQWQVTQIEEKRASAPLSRDAICDVEVERRIALRNRAAAQVEVARIGLEMSESDYKLDTHAAQARVAVAKSAMFETSRHRPDCRCPPNLTDGRSPPIDHVPHDLVPPAVVAARLACRGVCGDGGLRMVDVFDR
jgi:hypothetical protein